MKSKLREPPNDSIRKAFFRQQARELVFIDRTKRKAKCVVDTAGMIAGALERAYRHGFEDAQREGPAWNGFVAPYEDAVEWITIPARARKLFEGFAYCAFGPECNRNREAHYTPAITERGTDGWSLHWVGERQRSLTPLQEAKDAVAHQTMAILLRLGLVIFADETRKHIVISERGRNTWLKFCKAPPLL